MFAAHYTIHPEISLVFYKIEGAPELTKMIDFYEAVCRDPDFDAGYSGVGDWRNTTRSMSRSDVVKLSSYVKERQLSNGHWVALVDRPVATALAQIYAGKIHPLHPLDVCCTVKGASEILGIDLSQLIEEER